MALSSGSSEAELPQAMVPAHRQTPQIAMVMVRMLPRGGEHDGEEKEREGGHEEPPEPAVRVGAEKPGGGLTPMKRVVPPCPEWA